MAVAVGILCGEKAPVRTSQIAVHIQEGLLCHSPIDFFTGQLKRHQVGRGKQRVIVQHFFKMRHKPKPVGGVSGKAKADVIKDAAPVHLNQRFFSHIRLGLQQQVKDMRRWKFGRVSKPAEFFIKGLLQL
ncbi:hypothetical protein SDC9_116267 [bioreactor metagenome]|uniref:Uncharacterized protein n=1 Tax=bioreactor metagenome TaxID=1076179 RepID=A0A645BVN5_9ZZZZ